MTFVRKIVANLALCIFSILLVLAMLEVALRFIYGKELYLKQTVGIESKRAQYLFTPNQRKRSQSSKNNEFDVMIRINNYGFRGQDIKKEKAPGEVRIFAVGDSFTFGVGVEEDETIPYLIETGLRADELPVEVINAGRGHASPASQYLKLRDIFLAYQPDVVMLLFDFSDLWDDWHTERNFVYAEDGTILHTDSTVIYGKKSWWITMMRHSEFCAYINKKIVRTVRKIKVLGLKEYLMAKLKGKRAKAVISNMDIEQQTQSNEELIEYDGRLFLRGRDKLPHILKHWERTKKYLIMIRDLLNEHDITFIMTLHPYGIHVGPEEWGAGRVFWGFEQNKIYNDYFAFELIENFARENNIIFINTLNAFLQAKSKNKSENLFFSWDGHLTPAGNVVFADAITRNEQFHTIVKNRIGQKSNET